MEQPKKILVKKPTEPVVNIPVQDSVKKKVMVKVLTPQQKRAEMDSIVKIKRAEILRKKDSILDRQAASKGLTREQQKEQQKRDAKKADCKLDGLNVAGANKRGESKGSCSTGQTNEGESLKDTK